MIKNIIITIQAAILVFVAIWAYFYQHRVEQIFVSQTISNLAVEARLKIQVAERIKSGQSDVAQRILRNVAASNVKWAGESVAKLDLRMEDLVLDAEHSAKLLDEVGAPELSQALQARRNAFKE